METTLYDLLHNRGLRLNYFRDQSVLSNEWRNISTERVRKTANQILLQNHRELKARFANLYQEWAQRFSFDQIDNSGLELSANFLESDYYKNSKYLTKDNHESDVFEAFNSFCSSFWFLVKDRQACLNKYSIRENSTFHVHIYRKTTKSLNGPHPLDMEVFTLNFSDLKKQMQNYLTIANDETPILIHTNSNDDLYDHTYGATWLGKTLPLNFSQLE